MYLNRIQIATYLPFRAYNTDNQLITHSGDVKTFYPKSNLISKNVLAKKSLNNDSNRFQAQKAQKHTEEYAEKPPLAYPKNAIFAAAIDTFTQTLQYEVPV